MNGRVYDYNLGRFLSVDPFVHSGSQGLNPYSYLMNNPLWGTDPTGYVGCKEGDSCTESTTTKNHYETKTGSRIKTKTGSTATTTTTNQNGDTVNTSSVTVMSNGNFQTSNVSYENGAATQVSASQGNFKTGDIVGVNADLGSQSNIAESSAGTNQANSSGSLSANWCFQGACRTGVGYDLDVRSLAEIDQGIDDLTGYMSTAAGGLAGLGKAFAAKMFTKLSDDVVEVFRAFGGDARAKGYSWTPTDPITLSNFRDAAGLPSGGASEATNTAEFLIRGEVKKADIIQMRSALPLDGNRGGLPEYIIDPKNVRNTDFKVIEP